MAAKLTQEEFVTRAKAIHGNSDCMDKVVYNGMSKKITLICPTHGEYQINAHAYLNGERCPKCKGCYKRTPDEFIEDAKKVHGDKYDYSKVESYKTHDKVTIICPIHGEFKQTWKSHLKGCGCPKCSGVGKKTTEEFVEELKAIHGDKYDYSKVEYKGAFTKVTLICPKHGEFTATPHMLLTSKTNCPKCSYEKISKAKALSESTIIERIKNVHGDKYDLSKVKYSGIFHKIELICPKHGSFFIRPHNVLCGQGCRSCGFEKNGNESRLTTEEFVAKAIRVHGDKYDYSKTNYTNTQTKVCIICHEKDTITGKEHGEFWQKPSDHLCGCGCKKCYNRYNYSREEFIEKANIVHNNKYDYSLIPNDFKYSKEKIEIICDKHGVFKVMPYLHLNGIGCPICKESYLEKSVAKLLERNEIQYERYKRFDWLVSRSSGFGLELDFYLPDYNIAIECQGRQHFYPIEFFGGEKSFNTTVFRDNEKNSLCTKHNIKILYYTNVILDDYPYEVILDDDMLLNKIKGA